MVGWVLEGADKRVVDLPVIHHYLDLFSKYCA